MTTGLARARVHHALPVRPFPPPGRHLSLSYLEVLREGRMGGRVMMRITRSFPHHARPLVLEVEVGGLVPAAVIFSTTIQPVHSLLKIRLG
jgi:hypothetical protein